MQSWLGVIERFYLTFALTTWTERIARAIQKERKVYRFQEVDFLLANDREPLLLVEAKLADQRPTEPLLKIQRAPRIPAVQLVRNARAFRTFTNDSLPVVVAPACCWLAALPV